MSKKMESIFSEIFRLFLKAAGTIFVIVSIFMMGSTSLDLFVFQEPTNRYEIDNVEYECREKVYGERYVGDDRTTDTGKTLEEIEEILEKGGVEESLDILEMKKEILTILREQKTLSVRNEAEVRQEYKDCLVTETEKSMENWEARKIKTLIYGGTAFVIGIFLLLAGRRRK